MEMELLYKSVAEELYEDLEQAESEMEWIECHKDAIKEARDVLASDEYDELDKEYAQDVIDNYDRAIGMIKHVIACFEKAIDREELMLIDFPCLYKELVAFISSQTEDDGS